jgi:hypothetical protein
MAGDGGLTRAVRRLADRVAHWTPARWNAQTGPGRSRAESVYELVQEMADLAADAEGQPRRQVPRLANDLSLPDQLRVVTNDLIAAAPDPAVLAGATERVAGVSRALGS